MAKPVVISNNALVINCKVHSPPVADKIARNLQKELDMHKQDVINTVKEILIHTLSLDMAIDDLSSETALLGNFAEFDSMAIVSVITAIEESFQFTAEDDELSAEVFETVESLTYFVVQKTA